MLSLVTSSDKPLLYLFPEHCLLLCSWKEKNSLMYAFTEFVYLGLSLVQVLLQAGVLLLQVIALACSSFQ